MKLFENQIYKRVFIVIIMLVFLGFSLFLANLYYRQHIINTYNIYHVSKQNLVDPDALTTNIELQTFSSRFDPYANIVQYTKDDWEHRMTLKYGNAWKTW